MCGIVGIIAFEPSAQTYFSRISQATQALKHRGPDDQSHWHNESVALGHSRLSVLDLSTQANQPLWDASKRYALIYNGEIFNHLDLKKRLQSFGFSFVTHSDAEVLLYSYIHWGERCLQEFNGFFSFAIYDSYDHHVFIARDRFGEKPLVYFYDQEKFIFASEAKAFHALGIKFPMNLSHLSSYLSLHYLPGESMFKGVHVLEPGHYIEVKNKQVKKKQYYILPQKQSDKQPAYKSAQATLYQLLDQAVQLRLQADVPIGAFLSGGVDSAIISALAANHYKNLPTFSMGFPKDAYFDETPFALKVSKHIGSDHTVIPLSEEEITSNVVPMLDVLDEPFADSSALLVYILSQQVSKQVKVVLTGDGADELFAGYRKHQAEYRIRNQGFQEKLVLALGPLWKCLPKSRNYWLSDFFRKADKFSASGHLSEAQRHVRWAMAVSSTESISSFYSSFQEEAVQRYWSNFFSSSSFTEVLSADMQIVLPYDMLTKVDLMSMAHGLETRQPFLDVNVVDYVMPLPDHYKIDHFQSKKLLKEAFRQVLPLDLFKRPKHGFELPLTKLWKGPWHHLLQSDYFSSDFIQAQGIFNHQGVQQLKQQIFSASPGDASSILWSLLVFQHWYKKNQTLYA